MAAPEHQTTFGRWLVRGVLLLLLLLGLQVVIINRAKPWFDMEPNEVGDSFGAMNAIISGFAFIALIVTLVMQGEELKLQRQELQETREELRGSRRAQEAQVQMSLQSARITALAAILNHKTQLYAEHRSSWSSSPISDMKRWSAELEAEIVELQHEGRPWEAANAMLQQMRGVLKQRSEEGSSAIEIGVLPPQNLPPGLQDALSAVNDHLLSLEHLNSFVNGQQTTDDDDPLKPILKAWLLKMRACLSAGIRREAAEVAWNAGDAND